jgi:hypothetical protein
LKPPLRDSRCRHGNTNILTPAQRLPAARGSYRQPNYRNATTTGQPVQLKIELLKSAGRSTTTTSRIDRLRALVGQMNAS